MMKNSIIPAIDALTILSAPFNPVALAVWFVIKNLYGLYADLNMDEVDDFFKEVDKRLTDLKLDILNDNNFKKGLLLQTEEIIKTRSKEKIKILKQIFLNGFMDSGDKENFELDRMNATIRMMTLESFKFLIATANDIEQKPGKALQATNKIDKSYEQLESLAQLGILIKGGLLKEKIEPIVEESNKNPQNSKVYIADYYDEDFYCLSIFGQEILKYISEAD